MEQRHIVPAKRTRVETRVSNSRFITTLTPAFSVAEARAFLEEMRSEFQDATHNVPVSIIGHGAAVTAHCSDDGEPAGTAGRPALAVLQGSGLGDVAVVITRYFGGTKLGTGGLVRAYSESMRAVLEQTPLAMKVPTHSVAFAVPYNLFERLELLIQEHRGQILDKQFAGDVTFYVRFPQEVVPPFANGLQELTRGEVSLDIIESETDTLFPLPPSSQPPE